MDLSSYLVSSSPNIWVFDDLLSSRVLEYINSICNSVHATEFHQTVQGDRKRLSRSWSFDLSKDTQEVFEAIGMISGVNCTETFKSLLVTDVRGDSQLEHMDHISLDHLARRYSKLDFIDMTKQSESRNSKGFIVPTLSMALYLNDVGGVHFPKASGSEGLEIAGKPGRIIMWQNYIDSKRPHHNELAQHYGKYFEDRPKRLVTMGVLANETPAMGSSPKGIVYCPGMLDKAVRHDGCHVGGHLHTDVQPVHEPALKPKDRLVLTVTGKLQDDVWEVLATNMAGNNMCCLRFKTFDKFSSVRKAICQKVDPKDECNVALVDEAGNVMDYEQTTLDKVFAHKKPDDSLCRAYTSCLYKVAEQRSGLTPR
eukprot:TRINITY_DN100198_c0_g1_i1.p1 TRINITY_DN100198_c0_g1~~TRINITY_DN100198_c0_g1_i1.p1  ORF type:complete len:379 (+),score=54.12 TRINITY_DN100198_c0_g1_i1:35-1138(+)